MSVSIGFYQCVSWPETKVVAQELETFNFKKQLVYGEYDLEGKIRNFHKDIFQKDYSHDDYEKVEKYLNLVTDNDVAEVKTNIDKER